jgi:hypothetical protein
VESDARTSWSAGGEVRTAADWELDRLEWQAVAARKVTMAVAPRTERQWTPIEANRQPVFSVELQAELVRAELPQLEPQLVRAELPQLEAQLWARRTEPQALPEQALPVQMLPLQMPPLQMPRERRPVQRVEESCPATAARKRAGW